MTLIERYREAYEEIYMNRGRYHGEDCGKFVDRFDELMQEHGEFAEQVETLVNLRHDFISSDDEAAAAYIAICGANLDNDFREFNPFFALAFEMAKGEDVTREDYEILWKD